jgi:hypothetical protein
MIYFPFNLKFKRKINMTKAEEMDFIHKVTRRLLDTACMDTPEFSKNAILRETKAQKDVLISAFEQPHLNDWVLRYSLNNNVAVEAMRSILPTLDITGLHVNGCNTTGYCIKVIADNIPTSVTNVDLTSNPRLEEDTREAILHMVEENQNIITCRVNIGAQDQNLQDACNKNRQEAELLLEDICAVWGDDHTLSDRDKNKIAHRLPAIIAVAEDKSRRLPISDQTEEYIEAILRKVEEKGVVIPGKYHRIFPAIDQSGAVRSQSTPRAE